MNDYVLPLSSEEVTLAVGGGKAANLSQLLRAGFTVPDGYVIGTAGYREFVHANDLQAKIVALAQGGVGTDFTAAAQIRRLFERGKVPANLENEIREAYARLGASSRAPMRVAIRSSATAEDLPGASFAGQQETFLNVRGEEAVLQAVRRCWASLWTARAMAYRARQGIDPAAVTLAVVIQVMVEAAAAGVMFTANPLTGARDETVIDAARGLGEAVVSGLITPQQITADKTSGAVKLGPQGVLTADQVAQLVRVGNAIETHYGTPQDIEWCFDVDGWLWIVQSRPITTLPPAPVSWLSPVPQAKWLKDVQAGEWATEPLSPLGATTTFGAMITARQRKFRMQQAPWYALINGWLYIRADFRMLQLTTRPLWWALRIATGSLDGHRRTRRAWPPRLSLLDRLESSTSDKLSDRELRRRAGLLLGELGWWWWEVSWYAAAAIIGESLITRLQLPGLTDPAILFRGNDSLLLDAERALRAAAQTGDTEGYLARFGHFVESADPIHPTLRESPDLLTQHLAVAGQSVSHTDQYLARTRKQRAEAEKVVHAVRGVRGTLARRVLRVGQSYAAHTDDAVFHFQRVLALIRAAYLQRGARLADAGQLLHADDVFYLKAVEAWAAPANAAALVAQRREERERHKKLVPPPSIPHLSDPAWIRDPGWKVTSRLLGVNALRRGIQERNGRRILIGSPASPGRARGIARLITGPDDFHRFQPGDVLVAHATTPIWTPLFNIAAAAVTEVGGAFSHAAIVAREFGIPLVNGALNATTDIPDGTPVVVDGSAGTVEL